MENVEQVVSNAVIIGRDLTDESASGVDIYKNSRNHRTALSSLLFVAQERAKYNPTLTTGTENVKAFLDYLEELNKIPYLTLKRNDRAEREITDQEKSPRKLISGIKSLFSHVANGKNNCVRSIERSVDELATTIFSCIKAKETRQHFGQFIISVEDDGSIKLYVYNTKLEISYEKKGKAEIVEQKYFVNISEYDLNGDLLVRDADMLAYVRKVTAVSWITGVKSKFGDINQLCYKAGGENGIKAVEASLDDSYFRKYCNVL